MKTAFIWAIDGDIGAATAQRLQEEGWRVVGTSHSGQATAQADVSNEFSVQQAVMTIGQEVEQVDLWVYAAGDITFANAADLELAGWQQVINANLTGAYLTLHHSLPLLAEDAHIVFIGALSEQLQFPRLSAYAAAKAGLEAFVAVLGKEERKRTVTLIRPGAVATKFWERGPAKLPKQHLQADEVAAAILEAHASKQGGQIDLLPEHTKN